MQGQDKETGKDRMEKKYTILVTGINQKLY